MKTRFKKDRGALYKLQKRKSNKSPNYMGELNINDQAFFIAGWIETNWNGEEYLSLVVREKPEEAKS